MHSASRDRSHRVRRRDDAIARVPVVTRWLAVGSVAAVGVTALTAAASAPGHSGSATTPTTTTTTSPSGRSGTTVRQHTFQRPVRAPRPAPVAPPAATSGGS